MPTPMPLPGLRQDVQRCNAPAGGRARWPRRRAVLRRVRNLRRPHIVRGVHEARHLTQVRFACGHETLAARDQDEALVLRPHEQRLQHPEAGNRRRERACLVGIRQIRRVIRDTASMRSSGIPVDEISCST
jgi:hypothetical protein